MHPSILYLFENSNLPVALPAVCSAAYFVKTFIIKALHFRVLKSLSRSTAKVTQALVHKD